MPSYLASTNIFRESSAFGKLSASKGKSYLISITLGVGNSSCGISSKKHQWTSRIKRINNVPAYKSLLGSRISYR